MRHTLFMHPSFHTAYHTLIHAAINKKNKRKVQRAPAIPCLLFPFNVVCCVGCVPRSAAVTTSFPRSLLPSLTCSGWLVEVADWLLSDGCEIRIVERRLRHLRPCHWHRDHHTLAPDCSIHELFSLCDRSACGQRMKRGECSKTEKKLLIMTLGGTFFLH